MLHRAVREELGTFLCELDESGARPLLRYVLEALRGYLRCGVLAHGFSRLHCDRCGHDLLVAFSCKRRSICPSCGVRRMDEQGAALVDGVLPDVPYRQWVLSLPWDLRASCARVVATDGVFVVGGGGGLRFVPLPEPTAEQVERVMDGARLLRRRGRGSREDAHWASLVHVPARRTLRLPTTTGRTWRRAATPHTRPRGSRRGHRSRCPLW